MVSVLIDQDAIAEGLVASGKPWRYYDLGHGFCTYDFLSNAPSDGMCKMLIYMPKSSSEAQYLEGRQNLLKLMQEIPLTDDRTSRCRKRYTGSGQTFE